MMHAANPKTSDRLQRVLALLNDGAEHSTREIVEGADVVAVSSCIAELRVAGYYITCRRYLRHSTGRQIYLYRLHHEPEQRSLLPTTAQE